MQTPEGVITHRATMIKKHGSEEAWKAYMRTIASQGGKNSKGYDFAHGKLSPKAARKGKKAHE